MIYLEQVYKADLKEIHQIKKKAFEKLYQKYKDIKSPFNESFTSLKEKHARPNNYYFKIKETSQTVGYLRVVTNSKQTEARVSPIGIHPQYDGFGYGTQAMLLVEKHFSTVQKWDLSTIYQEEKLLHFYLKLGYEKTGEMDWIQENMAIIYFTKNK
ncbi:GNAT family N-acetyltransferase [Enterococcus sp. LJL98]